MNLILRRKLVFEFYLESLQRKKKETNPQIVCCPFPLHKMLLLMQRWALNFLFLFAPLLLFSMWQLWCNPGFFFHRRRKKKRDLSLFSLQARAPRTFVPFSREQFGRIGARVTSVASRKSRGQLLSRSES